MRRRENPFVVAPRNALARRAGVPRVSAGALYDDWLMAETDATLALAAWRTAARHEKAAAYARYVARTEAEEVAAVRLYEHLGETGDKPGKTG
jgi:hypothetical protein